MKNVKVTIVIENYDAKNMAPIDDLKKLQRLCGLMLLSSNGNEVPPLAFIPLTIFAAADLVIKPKGGDTQSFAS